MPSHPLRALLSGLLFLTACGDIGLQSFGSPSDHSFSPSPTPEGAGGDETSSGEAGSDESTGGGSADSDDDTTSPADEDTVECTFDQLLVDHEQATQDNSTPSQPLFAYQARTGESPPFDALQILSYQAAPYYGPAQPGTYNLSGMNYANCGLCVLLLGDCNNSNQCDQVFFVREGTLEIENLSSSGGPFRATLRDAVFEEVTIDPATYTSTPISGGDVWCLDEVRINAVTELYN